MKNIEDFFKRILPSAPGANEPAMADAIRRAAEEFCIRTRLWRYDDTITLTGDDTEIVVVPVGAALFEIESAYVDGLPLTSMSIADLNRDYPDWRTWTGQAKYMTQIEPDTLRLVPYPETGTLTIDVFLKPSSTATQLPDFMFTHHTGLLADGALAELLVIPGQSFTDPARAQFFKGRFDAQLDRLASAFVKGQQKARIRTRPVFF